VSVPLFSIQKGREDDQCAEGMTFGELPHPELDQIDFIHLQLPDDWCKGIYDHIADHPLYFIQQGMLYKETRRGGVLLHQVACPISLRGFVIESYHSSEFTAHLGQMASAMNSECSAYVKFVVKMIKEIYIMKRQNVRHDEHPGGVV
jgi:hypothetical protein